MIFFRSFFSLGIYLQVNKNKTEMEARHINIVHVTFKLCEILWIA